MADKKISALTAATTPLAGTEVLPIVQSGSTVKVAVSDLTAGRTPTMNGANIRSANAIRFYRGDNAIYSEIYNTTGGGGGCVLNNQNSDGFSFQNGGVTQVRINDVGNLVVGTAGKGIDFSANANAPGMTSEVLDWYEEGDWTPSYSGWSVDPTTAYAKYTRVGRLVTLHYVAENGTAAAASGVIGGLPFTSNAQQGASVAMKDTSFNSPGVTAFATINPNSTNIQSMTAANFAGLYWAFSTTYMV